MTENELLEYILDRLGRNGKAEETFGADEIANWPPAALNVLIQNKLLRSAPPAQVIECDGCEEYCPMPVHVIPGEEKRPARAFVSCDKRDDIGRVPVDLHRLEQWKITGSLLAKKLAALLGFEKTPQEVNRGKRWVLGILKGKDRKGPVVLTVENGVFLNIAGHDLPLAEALTFRKDQLLADKDELLRLVDKPAMSFGYKPSVAQRESRKSDTQKVHQAWQKAYREWKRRRPGMSDVWYSQQIAKSEIAEGRDSETIRKNMKK